MNLQYTLANQPKVAMLLERCYRVREYFARKEESK